MEIPFQVGIPSAESSFLTFMTLCSAVMWFISNSVQTYTIQRQPMVCAAIEHDSKFENMEVLGTFCHSSFNLTPNYDFAYLSDKHVIKENMAINYDFLRYSTNKSLVYHKLEFGNFHYRLLPDVLMEISAVMAFPIMIYTIFEKGFWKRLLDLLNNAVS